MSNFVQYSPEFKRRLKPFQKKYPTIKDNVKALQHELAENPYLGEAYGDKIYKVRLADESKGKGKSGSFRVMYYLLEETEQGINILLLTIFDKSEADTIKKKSAVKLKDYILKSMGIDPKK